MTSKLSQWCEGFIEAGWLAALILAPLFFNVHSDRVFEPDKLTLIRSIAVMMSVAWLIKLIDQQGWQRLSWLGWQSKDSIWRMPFVLPVVLLVVVYLLSTAMSIVPRVSWAGSYQRLQGTYTTLSYIVIFALTAVTIHRPEQVNRLLTTAIITSIPISLYALLQHFALDPLPWGGNVQARVAGHMGNAIFIAAYLILIVPVTIARILDAFTAILNEEELAYADVIRSAIYIFTLAIQILAIYWSGSRGPMLGLIVGIFAFILILLVALRNSVADRRFNLNDGGQALLLVAGGIGVIFVLLLLILRTTSLSAAMASFVAFVGAIAVVTLAIFVMITIRRGWRWLWFSWMLLTLVVGLWLALFNVPVTSAEPYLEKPIIGPILSTMEEWRTLPTVGRFGRILEADEGTGRVRVLIWQGALKLLTPHEPIQYPDGRQDPFNFLRPLIGYGPEAMYVAYNGFYPPELASIEARNASPDRSHNETFDALIITGLSGFLVWQALYLSVFYYGFKWLGVVRSKRDRNVLVAFWIGGAFISLALITSLLGPEYLGVAVPFGSIGGLILYLVYYALSASGGEQLNPFESDRLLLLALLSAVAAHYTEVHFGIAIASTRVYFFVYVALLFVVGYLLPRAQQEPVAVPVEADEPAGAIRRQRRKRTPAPRLSAAPAGWFGPILTYVFVLSLIIGTLAFNFINYAIPPGVQIQTIQDVPSAGAILQQAFFINQSRDFTDSPFIYLLITLSWALGSLLALSELAQQKLLKFHAPAGTVAIERPRIAGIIFIALLLTGLAIRLLTPAGLGDNTQLVGQGFLLVWSGFCLWAAFRLFQSHPAGRQTAAAIATLGLVAGIAVLVAGHWTYAISLLVACSAVLYLLWAKEWNEMLVPAGILSISSFLIGMAYAWLQASQFRVASFLGPAVVTASELERQILNTDQFATFLTIFYLFALGLMLLATFGLVRAMPIRTRENGSPAGFTALTIIGLLGLYLVSLTNLRIVQADMVYKRARPLDQAAIRSTEAANWDPVIATYEHAIELAPQEDFYFLFLGRAYLEKSARAPDPNTQIALLDTAKLRLQTAQEINPLNTDHTANLARLTTRWAALTNDPAGRSQLLTEAENYYQEAIILSPQNAVIRNEYANLAIALAQDCPAGIARYQQSLEIDPYFADTYFALAGAYDRCASALPTDEQADYFRQAITMLQAGLERRDRDQATIWGQIAELYRRAGDFQQALDSLDQARLLADPQLPGWTIDFRAARIYLDMGQEETARQLAQQAFAAAPPEQQAQIQAFLDNLP